MDKHTHFPDNPKLILKTIIKTQTLRMGKQYKFHDILLTKYMSKIKGKEGLIC